jgi:hypothetical protein
LYELINQNRAAYKNSLGSFLSFEEYFLRVPVIDLDAPRQLSWSWKNLWLPGLDAVALYSFICLRRPKRYVEIGSGISTQFARRAIQDHNLLTKITSIDPKPRAHIDALCDRVIRRPVEVVDLAVFDELEAGDVLFIDGSHRCFMNSDVAVVFLDVLPRLRSGVLVEFHDILLPYDYPPGWRLRYYSEQYLLAAYLLARSNSFQVVLPNFFITRDPELGQVLGPLWAKPGMKGVQSYGSSFWIETTSADQNKPRMNPPST